MRTLPLPALLRHLVIAHPTLAVAVVLLGCAPSVPPAAPEIVVAATDYAFALPATIATGRATFRLQNQGKVPHEMALGRLRAGITADSALAYAAAGQDVGALADGIVGILIAGPGETSIGTVSTDLIAGRTYMMICQFKDADSLPPHIAMGMQASFVAQ